MSVEPPVPRTKGTPAVSLCVLKKRADFLRAARGHRVPAGSFLLQAYNRREEDAAVRVGYTCSKKVGNAVARNRAKRRLREAAPCPFAARKAGLGLCADWPSQPNSGP